jgi:hypothetical protein
MLHSPLGYIFTKLFNTRFRLARDVKLANVAGTVPVSRLLFNPRYVRATKFPMLPGIGPVIELKLVAR